MTNANPKETETVKNKHLESQFAFYSISHQTQGKFRSWRTEITI